MACHFLPLFPFQSLLIFSILFRHTFSHRKRRTSSAFGSGDSYTVDSSWCPNTSDYQGYGGGGFYWDSVHSDNFLVSWDFGHFGLNLGSLELKFRISWVGIGGHVIWIGGRVILIWGTSIQLESYINFKMTKYVVTLKWNLYCSLFSGYQV